MNKMCRFCLLAPDKDMTILSEDCEILRKIKLCLYLEIRLNKVLPSQICDICVNKIEDIYEYHKKIVDNQEILIKLIKENNFKSTELPINIEIKLEPYDTNLNDASVLTDIGSIKNDPNNSDNEVLSELNLDKESINEIQPNEILNLKTEVDFGNIPYKCLTCFVDCKSQTELIKHYIDHGGNENLMIDHISNLYENVDKQYTNKEFKGNIVFECNICGKSFDEKDNIVKHVNGHIRPFLCKICGRTYRSIYEIIRHGRAHNGQNFYCSHGCGFSTVYKGALKDHEKRHGTPNFKYTCEKCGKGFHVKTWHDQHQNIHNGLKPFVCDICGVAFHMKRYLTTHRSNKHPQSSSIKKHVCVECYLPCDSRNSLKKHMEDHGVKSTLLCDLCGKVFTNSELLKHHKNGHLGVKPYTCNICNKGFAKKFNLKIHIDTHTCARAHSCTQCGKNFTQTSALRRHRRRHHPESEAKEKEDTISK